MKICLAIALLMLLGHGAGPVTAQVVDGRDELRLRPGDAVRIQIKDEPELSNEFLVDDDGDLLLPLVGIVRVAGRPFTDVRAEVRAAYAVELVDPVMVVTPLIRIAVLGEVRQPGLFPVDPTHTLADILALAGGLTPVADDRRISLVRNGDVRATAIRPGEPILATRLHSGDQIVVARRSWFREHMPILVGAGASVAAAAITSLIIR